jgi:hypothetical protein
MATGLHRDRDEWVMVDHGNSRMPIPRDRYVPSRYRVPNDKLPIEQQYIEAELKAYSDELQKEGDRTPEERSS